MSLIKAVLDSPTHDWVYVTCRVGTATTMEMGNPPFIDWEIQFENANFRRFPK
jgi:hypothetical protein